MILFYDNPTAVKLVPDAFFPHDMQTQSLKSVSMLKPQFQHGTLVQVMFSIACNAS